MPGGCDEIRGSGDGHGCSCVTSSEMKELEQASMTCLENQGAGKRVRALVRRPENEKDLALLDVEKPIALLGDKPLHP